MGLLILFWLVCAIIAAIIGDKKGEAGIGCLAGFLLGPIGILMALVSTGNRKPCPYCQEPVNKAASVCPHCRKDLTAPSSPPA